jgi:tRNA pseudouridine38-40 synthase
VTGDISRTVSLTLAYEGTAFAGWQRQPERRTVQAVVEEVLAAIDERPAPTRGCTPSDR